MRPDMIALMMPLLKKDLRMTRVFWVPACFSFGAFLLVFFENSWFFLGCGICLTCVLAAVPMAIDDHYRTDPLFAGLPGRRSSLVGGRYLSWGVSVLIALVLFLAVAAILLLALKSKAAHLAPLLSMRGALLFFGISTLAGLAFLPSYFRFGFWKGLGVFAAGGFGLAVIFSFLAPFLAPPSGGKTGRASAASGPLAVTIEAFLRIVRKADDSLRNPLFPALTAVVLVILVLASFRLSLAFYDRRDL
jgi:ABC-type transport system involved in multi-copper enzyme maturation permease subunit